MFTSAKDLVFRSLNNSLVATLRALPQTAYPEFIKKTGLFILETIALADPSFAPNEIVQTLQAKPMPENVSKLVLGLANWEQKHNQLSNQIQPALPIELQILMNDVALREATEKTMGPRVTVILKIRQALKDKIIHPDYSHSRQDLIAWIEAIFAASEIQTLKVEAQRLEQESLADQANELEKLPDLIEKFTRLALKMAQETRPDFGAIKKIVCLETDAKYPFNANSITAVPFYLEQDVLTPSKRIAFANKIIKLLNTKIPDKGIQAYFRKAADIISKATNTFINVTCIGMALDNEFLDDTRFAKQTAVWRHHLDMINEIVNMSHAKNPNEATIRTRLSIHSELFQDLSLLLAETEYKNDSVIEYTEEVIRILRSNEATGDLRNAYWELADSLYELLKRANISSSFKVGYTTDPDFIDNKLGDELPEEDDFFGKSLDEGLFDEENFE